MDDVIAAERPPLAAWYALAVLAIVIFVSLLDRQILLLVAEPIRRDLGLSDLELGLVQGFGVALFATLAGMPLGWAADRFDRRVVLIGCIAFWSLAVVGCALSQSFVQLLLAGALVGAGEAGISPVLYAFIPMYFFGRRRQIANSIAIMASVGGGAFAFAAAGLLVSLTIGAGAHWPAPFKGLADWRIALICAALLSPAIIGLVCTIRIPHVRAHAAAPPDGEAPAGHMDGFFRRHLGTYVRFLLGGALGSFAFAAFGIWTAIAAGRLFAEQPQQIGASLGVAQLGSALGGFLLSLAVAQVLGDRLGTRMPIRTFWVGTMIAAAVLLALPRIGSAAALYGLFAFVGVFLTCAVMSFPTALQTISPPGMRGRVASLQFVAFALTSASAPPLVGFTSDLLAADGSRVLVAMALVAVPALAIAALLMRSCEGRRLEALLADLDQPDPATPPGRPDNRDALA